MTLDKEFEVAVEAVKLVISVLRYHREMLTDKVGTPLPLISFDLLIYCLQFK